jgi:VWFA-related protein
MRLRQSSLAILLFFTTIAGGAQDIIRARSTLVLVPTLVETKKGEPVFALKPEDFVITDNGVIQPARLEEDTDLEPLALAVVIQTGREAFAQTNNLRGLNTMIDSLIGDVDRSVAVVAFDSQPQLIQDFTGKALDVSDALKSLQVGDGGAAILDAVKYATHLLSQQPKEYRRAVLLISETRDHGSHAAIQEVVQQVGETNTVVYSVAFSPSKTELKDSFRGNNATGPSANLLSPILMTIQAFRRNTSAAIAHLTGGEYVRFDSQFGFDQQIGNLTNHVHNRYILSFQPPSPAPGLHAIRVQLPEHSNLRVIARQSYWASAPPG